MYILNLDSVVCQIYSIKRKLFKKKVLSCLLCFLRGLMFPGVGSSRSWSSWKSAVHPRIVTFPKAAFLQSLPLYEWDWKKSIKCYLLTAYAFSSSLPLSDTLIRSDFTVLFVCVVTVLRCPYRALQFTACN